MSDGLHHLRLRKRLYKNLEKYPSPEWQKRILDRVMFGVAFVMPVVLLPQVIQLYVSKDAAGLSFVTWFFASLINFLWSLYGFVHKEKPLGIASTLVGVLNMSIAVGILLYR
ncbi:MAG: PQ-loop domain-containing transporter [bacterium]